MTTINKHTILNVDQAVDLLEDLDYAITGKPRILLREYAECLQRAELQQNQNKPNLLNPRSAAQSEDWRQVHQLVEDITWNNLDERLRSKILDLESQLKDLEVL